MELSMGTFVTIVLIVVAMVLGFALIRTIFQSGTSAIDQIDAAVQNEINKLFAEEGKKLVVYPASRQITLSKGDEPKGIAFSARNNDVESATFSYEVSADDVSKCGSLTEEQANRFMIGGTGEFSLGPGNTLDLPRLIKFDIPESAPPCTMVYNLAVSKGGEPYSSADIFVTVE